MAPKSKSTRFAAELDFIPTISSDDEPDVPDYDEMDSDQANAIDKANTAKPKNTENASKRKRVVTNGPHHEPSSAKKKRQKTQHRDAASANGVHVNSIYANEGESEDSDKEGDAGIDDGAFDPDFEFQIGGNEGDVFVGFGEAWEVPNGTENKKAERAIGIDEIVKRRREKERQIEARDQENDDDDEEDEADSEDALAFNGFEEDDDDELLAEDGFGMGAVPDADDADDDEEDASEDGEDDRSPSHLDQANGDEASEEEDEVAEPVPHPDDFSDGEDQDMDKPMTERQTAFFAPEDPVTQSKSLTGSFGNMSLSRPILRGLAAVGFSSPTPIQVKTVPVALLGKDVVGGAVTGSGKTAAFIIPILERLLYRPKKVPTTRVSILMPTRELAVQCYNVATKLASYTDITFALIVGGFSLREQEQTLRKRPDIVIATPGRFIDHMRNSASFAYENLEILVLDEADRMLEDGFADELNEVLTTIPKSRQTMLFSATMTEDVDQLIRVGLNRPVRLMVDAKRQTVQELIQEFIKMKGTDDEVDEDGRLAYLLHLCETVYTAKTIVFLPRKSLAHRVKVLFSIQGLKAAELHGSMSQEQRLNAMSSFRDGSCTHLLATDLASRGLDIPRVETVINFTVPTTTTTYLHRVGRTARAGQTGVSCTLFSAAKKISKADTKKGGGSTSERTLLRPIIRLARNQGAKVRTRTVPPSTINDLKTRVHSLKEEIESILLEEKEERLLQQSERDVTKGENLVKYQDEIASRPKRTWFQTEKEKEAASKLGKEQRLGVGNGSSSAKPKEKKKLSNKQKKRLQDHDLRKDGQNAGWKKGKNERTASKGSRQPVVGKKQKISKRPGK